MAEPQRPQDIAAECIEAYLSACQAQTEEEARKALFRLIAIAAAGLASIAGKDFAQQSLAKLKDTDELFEGGIRLEKILPN